MVRRCFTLRACSVLLLPTDLKPVPGFTLNRTDRSLVVSWEILRGEGVRDAGLGRARTSVSVRNRRWVETLGGMVGWVRVSVG